MSTLRASVTAGDSGPVIKLSGETDLTTAELSELVTAQLSGGTRHLTIDAFELSFADSASIRTLLLASRTLRRRGGDLMLLRPQRQLVRMLDLMGASQLVTIRGETDTAPEPEHEADQQPEVSPEPLSR